MLYQIVVKSKKPTVASDFQKQRPKFYWGKKRSHTTQTPKSTQLRFDMRSILNEIPHIAFNSVAGGRSLNVSRNSTEITRVTEAGLKPFIEQAMHCAIVRDTDAKWKSLKINFGKSLWIDEPCCVPSTPSWSSCLQENGPCYSCSWKRHPCFTMNVMPNSKHERRRWAPQAGQWPETQLISDGGADTRSLGRPSEFCIHASFAIPSLPEPSLPWGFWKTHIHTCGHRTSFLALFNGFLVFGHLWPRPLAMCPSNLSAWFLPLPRARSPVTWW